MKISTLRFELDIKRHVIFVHCGISPAVYVSMSSYGNLSFSAGTPVPRVLLYLALPLP